MVLHVNNIFICDFQILIYPDHHLNNLEMPTPTLTIARALKAEGLLKIFKILDIKMKIAKRSHYRFALYCLKTMFRMYINLPNWSYMSIPILYVIFKFFAISIIGMPTPIHSDFELWRLACSKISKFGISKWRLWRDPSRKSLYIA